MIAIAIAAINSYFDAFVSGQLSPFSTHAVLLGGAIVAEIAVAVGIWLESPKEKKLREWLGLACVFGGVVVSAVFTIALFVFDEGISTALQMRLAARTIFPADADKIRAVAINFPGQVFEIIPYWQDDESLSFGKQLDTVLESAGWKLEQPKFFVELAGVVTGEIVNVDPRADGKTLDAARELAKVLTATGFPAKTEAEHPATANVIDTKINISVGIKP